VNLGLAAWQKAPRRRPREAAGREAGALADALVPVLRAAERQPSGAAEQAPSRSRYLKAAATG
jgi:hypothetical protein